MRETSKIPDQRGGLAENLQKMEDRLMISFKIAEDQKPHLRSKVSGRALTAGLGRSLLTDDVAGAFSDGAQSNAHDAQTDTPEAEDDGADGWINESN